jgi:hypothetical protein
MTKATQHPHRCEQLLAGWEWVLLQNSKTTTTSSSGQTECQRNNEGTGMGGETTSEEANGSSKRQPRHQTQQHPTRMTMGRWRGGGNGTKKAHRMSSTSLGPAGRFFFHSHFVFILLTKLLSYYLNLLATTMTTEWPPPLACEPLACRVDCGDDETTGRRNGEEEDNNGGRETKWRGWRRWQPAPSLTSNYSWGGLCVEWQWWQRQRVATRSRARDNDDEPIMTGRGYDNNDIEGWQDDKMMRWQDGETMGQRDDETMGRWV